MSSAQPETPRPGAAERQVGVRGCLGLILKLIVALILIGAFIANWFKERELNLFNLILRQRLPSYQLAERMEKIWPRQLGKS